MYLSHNQNHRGHSDRGGFLSQRCGKINVVAHLKPGDVGIHKLGNLTLGHLNESQRRWGELPVFLIQHPP